MRRRRRRKVETRCKIHERKEEEEEERRSWSPPYDRGCERVVPWTAYRPVSDQGRDRV